MRKSTGSILGGRNPVEVVRLRAGRSAGRAVVAAPDHLHLGIAAAGNVCTQLLIVDVHAKVAAFAHRLLVMAVSALVAVLVDVAALTVLDLPVDAATPAELAVSFVTYSNPLDPRSHAA